MIEVNELEKIKSTIEEFLQKMTLIFSNIEAKTSLIQNKDIIEVNIVLEEPQILIGQNGQTLLELSWLLRIILTKKLKKPFYLELDINDYKKKKIEYLKNLAITLADEVSQTKEKKILNPMPSYERRIIHNELSLRKDVITQSQGEGEDRQIVITPV